MFFESCEFRGFAGRLTTSYSTVLSRYNVRSESLLEELNIIGHTWTIKSDNTVYSFSLNTIDYVIAYARHSMTVQQDLHLRLLKVFSKLTLRNGSCLNLRNRQIPASILHIY